MDFPPSQIEDVDAVIHVRISAVEQLRVGTPFDEHRGAPCPARHLDLIDFNVKRREEPAHALELHRLLSTALTSQCMIAGNPVIVPLLRHPNGDD